MKQKTIAEIKEKLHRVATLSDQERRQLEEDSRIGVRRLLRAWERRNARTRMLEEKYRLMNRFEDQLHAAGRQAVAGIDEAGRGPLAGPVVAACVILGHAVIPGLNDSKQLTAARRDALYDRICASAEAYAVGIVSARDIDRINIYQAAKQAMILAVANMAVKPDYLLIDAMELPLPISQQSLIKGDARSNSIAAASIVAKVTRDRLMSDLDRVYPGYGFSVHKGYGTRAHLQAIERLGTCPEHRMTFAPLKQGKDG